MRYLFLPILLLFLRISICQMVPFSEPLSKAYKMVPDNYYHISDLVNNEIEMQCSHTLLNKSICQLGITFDTEDLHILNFSLKNSTNNKIYTINDRNNNIYTGPYSTHNNRYTINPLKTKSLIIEVNTDEIIESVTINITGVSKAAKSYNKIENNFIYYKNNTRDEPFILLTGYWPPTNEMIRHFSQSTSLNPSGWQGENWENRGYDIISYFPEFSDPDCQSCGQGFGDLEVDYQDTTEDFWPITQEHLPIALITFSRGYMDQSWELEYNAYNRTNWYNDFTSPFQPTPNPPDSNEVAFYLRNSNLPMDGIVDAISALNIGLNPYIDINGDPGHYVSEYMAYHGTWYRDLNLFGDNNCVSGGHIHVGGNVNVETAKLATEESIRVLIDYVDSFTYTPGDLNQDDIIDILDLVTVVNFILGQAEFTNLQMYAADINEDSVVNIQDIIMIINIILS